MAVAWTVWEVVSTTLRAFWICRHLGRENNCDTYILFCFGGIDPVGEVSRGNIATAVAPGLRLCPDGAAISLLCAVFVKGESA